jgi:hypothetical protein
MSSRKQRNANYRNSLLSTGPKAESLEHTRFNGVKHGARSRTTVLPRENHEEYNKVCGDWNGDCRPRNPTEAALVLEIANAHWKLMRVERAQDERVAAGIGDAGTREEVAVFKKMERLFWDPRGPISAYALWPLAHGGPPTSWSGQVDDPNQPYLLVKDLEASAKGCQALLDEWTILRSRVEDNVPWQPPDRLKAIRMLGKQPIDVAIDRRLAQIYRTTFAMHPLGRKNAYDDLKCDLATIDLENFVKRIRTRWPREFSANDTEKAKGILLDLIARVVERLEGIRDAHLAHAEEVAAKTARRLAIDTTTEGERLQRYEMQCHRRFYKCLDAFWKHRREMERAQEGHEQEQAEYDVVRAEERVVLEHLSRCENKNVTSEANSVPAALEVEADQGVLVTGKAFKMADAGVNPVVDGGDRGRVEAISTAVAGERAVLGAVEGEIQSSEPPMRRDC